MKIAVCLKAVPGYVSRLQISDSGDRIEYESADYRLNDSDEYALEEALALKKQLGGEVVVITVGSLTAQRVLYTGLAKKADRAMRIDASAGSAELTSAALAEAIRTEGFDLILTGVESSDTLAAEVGARIAERLRVPYAYAVTDIEAGEAPDRIKVTKEIGGGTMQVLDMPLPALLSIQEGIQPISYVPVRRIMQAQTNQSIECFSLSQLSLAEPKAGGLKIVDVFPASETHRAELIDGEPAEIGRKLLQLINERTQ